MTQIPSPQLAPLEESERIQSLDVMRGIAYACFDHLPIGNQMTELFI